MPECPRNDDDVDLEMGVPVDLVPTDGVLSGRLGTMPLSCIVAENGITALEATCTHLGAPLAEGLVVDGTLRCPWHHACFDLATGAALRAPAFAALRRHRVTIRDGRVFVERACEPEPTHLPFGAPPRARTSSSSAEVLPVSPPLTCCGRRVATLRSPWSPTISSHRTTARC